MYATDMPAAAAPARWYRRVGTGACESGVPVHAGTIASPALRFAPEHFAAVCTFRYGIAAFDWRFAVAGGLARFLLSWRRMRSRRPQAGVATPRPEP
jgi:hypothetical protein